MSASKKRTCCILCGRPFKQSSEKGKSGRNLNQQSLCSVCKKKKKDISNKVYKKTNGKVKFVSFKDLVRVKNRIGKLVFGIFRNIFNCLLLGGVNSSFGCSSNGCNFKY